MAEEWRDVPGYEGLYKVSDLGRLKGHRGQVLKGSAAGDGYRKITLCKPGQPNKGAYVHRLVLLAFVGPCPDGMEACHRNAVKNDNRLVNLRWDTASENNKDIVRLGRHFGKRKTHCPRGHLLKEPNLVAFELRRGGRKCRSCAAANTKAHKAGQTLSKEIADAYYKRFTEGAA